MRGKAIIAIAAVAGVALAAGVAYATIPDAGGVIHGCYKTENGQLRVIESGSCGPGEAALTWNQTGHAGPPGPSGTLGWAHVAADGTVLGSSGNVAVAHIAPGAYCVGVTGGTAHAAMAVLDEFFNVGGTIETGVFFGSDCPEDASDIVVETRPQGQDGGLPGADRAYYLVSSSHEAPRWLTGGCATEKRGERREDMTRHRKMTVRTSAAAGAALCTAIVVMLAVGASPAPAAFPGVNGKIAFVSDQTGADAAISVMGADGSNPHRLTTNSGDIVDNPVWSPNGAKIVFTSERVPGTREVFVMDGNGGNQTRLTNTPPNFENSPTWSPDGRIAFTSVRDGNAEIYVMNADGSGQTDLTNDPAGDSEPAWSQDGKIAFTSSRDGNLEIYVMNADGSGQTRLTNDPAFAFGSAWSPDGSKIAFMSDRGGNYDVYVMNADGSGQTPLTDDPDFDGYPAWSPDGSKIAFTSNRDGDEEIYVLNLDDGSQTQLTDNLTDDSFPDWQRVDQTAPNVSCDTPDGIWHDSDVTLFCTATDQAGVGLANPVDGNFSLSTNVTAGTETAASTNSHQVCDQVGNCATAGPIGGNLVDKKAPTIMLTSPVDTSVYLLHQEVAAGYACLDPGSGVASCAAPVPSGANIATGNVGGKGFTVNSIDQVGNVSPAAVATYAVAYGTNLLFDASKPTKTITLRLVDADGANVSAPAIVLTVQTIDGAPVTGQTFSYVKNGSSYKYGSLKLPAGGHTLNLRAGADPTSHTIAFRT